MKAQVRLFLRVFIPLALGFAVIVTGGIHIYRFYVLNNTVPDDYSQWDSTFMGNWESHAYEIRLSIDKNAVYSSMDAGITSQPYKVEIAYYEGAYYILPQDEDALFGIYDRLIFYPDRSPDGEAPLLIGETSFRHYVNYKDTLYYQDD